MALLHIVRASAGSGKTFRLTLEYLSSLYDDTGNFRHILAVTFTNKATEEMKSRITGVLHELSAGKPVRYLKPLMQITGKTEKEIRLKSDIILRKILHNYSRFNVSTIDSFFQYIIRSFTRELGIQSNYVLELDDQVILGKAIDEMFQRIDRDKGLRDWLMEFTQSRIEDEKSWNLKDKIFELGKEIFKEKYKQFGDAIAVKLNDKAFLSSFKNQFYNIVNSFESDIKDFGKKAIMVLQEYNLEVGDFYQKSRGPAGFLQKLADGFVPEINSYTREVLHDPGKWCKNDNPRQAVIKEVCENSLHPLLHQVVAYYTEKSVAYNSAKIVLRNFYTLGILSDITTSVYKHTRNKNLFLISDSAQLINRIIDNNDAPFIYEKTGNYFHHFLIDEFQDTSDFQWQNFKPLISNSLSQDYNCLIVGDAKQSVYRWRNSNWEILSKDILNDFYHEAYQTESLTINRRSKKEIVDFNNLFFTEASAILQNHLNNEQKNINSTQGDVISQLYTDVIQQLPEPAPTGGYVRLEYISSESEYAESVLPKVIRVIEELQENGYSPGDIAILTRNKKEGKEVADYIMSFRQEQSPGMVYRFDVISEEALFISSSSAVKLIISVLRHITSPENHINNYFMLSEYLNYIKEPFGNDKNALLPVYTPQTSKENIHDTMPENFPELTETHTDYSLYEILQQIIRIFNIHLLDGEQVYVQALKDMIIDFTERNSSGLPAFLDYWDETGSSKAISGADNIDAIRILTIHKSKGLEFKAVIMPYCNWKMNPPPGTVFWCTSQVSPYNQLEILPVNYGSALEHTYFAEDYQNEKLKIYIDNLNLLYVAFTRAKDALYCFLPDDKSKPENGITNISHLVSKSILQMNSRDKIPFLGTTIDELVMQSGMLEKTEPEPGKQGALQKSEGLPEYDTLGRMRVAYHTKDFLTAGEGALLPLSYGKIMHELFAQIITLNDIDAALKNLYYLGKISGSEMELIRKELQVAFSDIQVQSWFSGDWKVLNERDIILRDHENKRPDRILIKDKVAVIIDYKFGEKETEEHRKQVAEYGNLLVLMGYENVETYLWYIVKNKIVKID